LNILYLDPYTDTPYSKRYLYYEGLYNSLIKRHDVFLFRKVIKDYNEIKKIIPFIPDVVIFGLSWFDQHKYFKKIKNLECTSICFIFKPSIHLKEKLEFCKINQVNLILTPHSQFKDYSEMVGISAKLFPYGFDSSIFKPRNLEKKYDIGFSGALHAAKFYPDGAFKNKNIRLKIHDLLKNINKINYFWKSTDVLESARIHDNIEYAETINYSKIWIATQAAFGDITPRYFEIMGSGALLFCEKNEGLYKSFFENRKNCIEFKSDLSNFLSLLNDLVENEQEIRNISSNGYSDAKQFHTWDVRAKELISIIEGLM
jgi:spore maturation protein CgeB